MGCLPQTWLGVSDDSLAIVTGRSLYRHKAQSPREEVFDIRFQVQVLGMFAELAGVSVA